MAQLCDRHLARQRVALGIDVDGTVNRAATVAGMQPHAIVLDPAKRVADRRRGYRPRPFAPGRSAYRRIGRFRLGQAGGANGGAAPFGRGLVDAVVLSVEGDAVQVFGAGARAQSQAVVANHAGGSALERIAVTAAAAAHRDQGVAGVQDDPILGFEDIGVGAADFLQGRRHDTLGEQLANIGFVHQEAHLHAAGTAAEQPSAFRLADAVRDHVDGERSLMPVRYEHRFGADAAAVPAGSAGVRALLAIDVQHRVLVLVGFEVGDRLARRAGDAAGVQSVAIETGAAAAGLIEQHGGEGLAAKIAAGNHRHLPSWRPACLRLEAMRHIAGRGQHLGNRSGDDVLGGVDRAHRCHADRGGVERVVDEAVIRANLEQALEGTRRPRHVVAQGGENGRDDAAFQAAGGCS